MSIGNGLKENLTNRKNTNKRLIKRTIVKTMKPYI